MGEVLCISGKQLGKGKMLSLVLFTRQCQWARHMPLACCKYCWRFEVRVWDSVSSRLLSSQPWYFLIQDEWSLFYRDHWYCWQILVALILVAIIQYSLFVFPMLKQSNQLPVETQLHKCAISTDTSMVTSNWQANHFTRQGEPYCKSEPFVLLFMFN